MPISGSTAREKCGSVVLLPCLGGSFSLIMTDGLIQQGCGNMALRLGVEGRGDTISTRSLLFRRGVFGSRPSAVGEMSRVAE